MAPSRRSAACAAPASGQADAAGTTSRGPLGQAVPSARDTVTPDLTVAAFAPAPQALDQGRRRGTGSAVDAGASPLADHALKPSEELSQPFAERARSHEARGRKTPRFRSGDVEYETKASIVAGANGALAAIEASFSVLGISDALT